MLSLLSMIFPLFLCAAHAEDTLTEPNSRTDLRDPIIAEQNRPSPPAAARNTPLETSDLRAVPRTQTATTTPVDQRLRINDLRDPTTPATNR